MSALAPVPPGIGIVAPFDLALDRELWRWTPEPVSLYLTRTPALDTAAVSLAMVEALGDEDALAAACREVAVPAPGVDRLPVHVRELRARAGGGGARCARRWSAAARARALTTSGALLEALAALGARRVAVATPYDATLTDLLVAFLGEAGIETTGAAHLGMGEDIWRVEPAAVLELARSVPRRRRRRAVPQLHEPADLRRDPGSSRPSSGSPCCRRTR